MANIMMLRIIYVISVPPDNSIILATLLVKLVLRLENIAQQEASVQHAKAEV